MGGHGRPQQFFLQSLKTGGCAFFIRVSEFGIPDHIGNDDGGKMALHPRFPFRERLAKHKGKIYLAWAGSNVAYRLHPRLEPHQGLASAQGQ